MDKLYIWQKKPSTTQILLNVLGYILGFIGFVLFWIATFWPHESMTAGANPGVVKAANAAVKAANANALKANKIM